jgi:hypothetical protein
MVGCIKGYSAAIKLSFYPSPGADTNNNPAAGAGAGFCGLYRDKI